MFGFGIHVRDNPYKENSSGTTFQQQCPTTARAADEDRTEPSGLDITRAAVEKIGSHGDFILGCSICSSLGEGARAHAAADLDKAGDTHEQEMNKCR